MRRLRAWVLRSRGLFDRKERDRDFAEEIEGHLQIHIGRGMTLAVSGITFGILGASAPPRILANLLYSVGVLDPWVLMAVSLLLGLVTRAVCPTPAYWATKVDPMKALRS